MTLLKQSTAYTRMFKMVDSGDHLSKKTGLTCTVNLSKAGAAFAAAGGSVAEVGNGWYKVSLSTTDTNTLGDLAFYITAAGADDTDFCDQVVSFDTQDANGLGLSRLDAAVTSRMATGDKTGYSLAAGGLDAIAVTDPGAPGSQTTLPKMIVGLWRWFFKKTTLTSTQLKVYADDGSTANGTASVSDDGTTQTKGSLS